MNAETYIQKDLQARFEGCYCPDITFAWSIIGNTRDLIDAEIIFTVKASINSEIIIEQKKLSTGGITVADDSVLSCVLTGRNLPVEYVAGNTYVYSLVVIYGNGDKVVIFRGNAPILKP